MNTLDHYVTEVITQPRKFDDVGERGWECVVVAKCYGRGKKYTFRRTSRRSIERIATIGYVWRP